MDRLFYLIPIVLVIVIIFGGATRLPEIGAGMGRAIREFRGAVSGTPDAGGPGTTPPSTGPVAGYDPGRQWAAVPETRPQAIVPDETLGG
jgi:TatA/E family protein of Tat protein translocase